MADLEAEHDNMVMDHLAKVKVKEYKLFEVSGNALEVGNFLWLQHIFFLVNYTHFYYGKAHPSSTGFG